MSAWEETQGLEIVCPAGTPAALKAAVEAGADSIYLGFADETNARNFPGLNFTRDDMADGIAFAHAHGVKALIAINTFPRAGGEGLWRRAVDDAARLGADAAILADLGLIAYAAEAQPELRRHLSVQASASSSEAIAYYAGEFGVKRAVLPRVLTLPQIAALTQATGVETEVFVFGGLCVMAEGRCSLSSYVTGQSPNVDGVCSPASHVRYEEEGGERVSKLGGVTINRFSADEPAGYPTLCKGRFRADGKTGYLFEEPTSLNAIPLVPALIEAGVKAIKIEGRQRGRAYMAKVIADIRQAVDAALEGRPLPPSLLSGLTEGGRETEGVYKKQWR